MMEWEEYLKPKVELGEVVGAVNGRVCEGVRVLKGGELELLMEALKEEMEQCMKEWQEEL